VLKRSLLAILVVILVGAAIAVAKMGPRNVLGMIRYDRRQVGRLRVGDRAPDVALLSLDGTTVVPLAGRFGARPCVVVFGSFT
jgi:hypothetical protein